MYVQLQQVAKLEQVSVNLLGLIVDLLEELLVLDQERYRIELYIILVAYKM